MRPCVRRFALLGVRANAVSIAAVLLSALAGVGLCVFISTPMCFLTLPVILFVRMGLNAADGMLAREHGQDSALGVYLNELGDVVSDAFLLLPFAFVEGVNGLGVAVVALLVALSEMAGMLALTAGGARRYDGPLGKSDRAIVLGAAGLWIGCAGGLPPLIAASFAPAMAVPLVFNTVVRVRRGIFPSGVERCGDVNS